jgi:hypothetical protein
MDPTGTGKPRRKRPPRPATSQAAPPRAKTHDQRQAEEWEATAAALKNDGYNSSVVTRKMITQFNMPEADAEALVGRLYGKKVSARTGDTTADVTFNLAMAAVAGTVLALMVWYVGFFPRFIFIIYAALLGAVGRGVSKALIALVNAGNKEALVKKD